MKRIINGITIIASLLLLTTSCNAADNNKEALFIADKELNNFYHEAIKLLHKGQRGKLQKEQREWIKKRNKECSASGIKAKGNKWLLIVAKNKTKSECVIRLTKKRVEELKEYTQARAGKRYPPYPEVWGYKVADPGYDYGASILAYPANDGDVYFTYTKKYLKRITAQNISEPCDNVKRFAYIKYFGQQDIKLTCRDPVN